MGDNPDLINLNYTSFASKEQYKPPTMAFFGSNNQTKKPRYTPGGEWAQDEESKTEENKLMVQEIPSTQNSNPENSELKQKSKFKFIQKPKETNTKTISNGINSLGVLDFSEIRGDQLLANKFPRTKTGS